MWFDNYLVDLANGFAQGREVLHGGTEEVGFEVRENEGKWGKENDIEWEKIIIIIKRTKEALFLKKKSI